MDSGENSRKKIHDSLFKEALSYPREAEKLIKAYTKPAILAHIDWSTLQISKTNFVSEELSQTYSDVVYYCRLLDQKTYLYFLLESQTEPDFYFPHRLEKYRLAIIEQHLKKEKFLPRLLTLCLYSGTSTFNMLDYANPDLNELFTSPTFNLISLSKYHDGWLKETGIFQVLLKLGGQKIEEVLGWIETHPDYVAKLLASPYKCGGVSYLLELEKRNDSLFIIENLIKLLPVFKDDIMTAAQQLRQEERLTVAKNMLVKLHLDIDTVQKATELTKEELQEILKERSATSKSK
jgi:predicted transposase YdaD